jgi:DNA-binding HxlR family transcriptional regulator
MICASIESDLFLCSACPNREAANVDECPARWFLEHFGDKWTLPVLGALNVGPLRFSQFSKALAPISERMLILSLKKLENNGLICREEANASALQNTYRLTPLGRSLLEHVADLYLWMNENAPAILAAYSGEAADPAQLGRLVELG